MAKECTFFKPNAMTKIEIITGKSEVKETTAITITLSMLAMDIVWLKIANDAFNGKSRLSTVANVAISVVASVVVVAVLIVKSRGKNYISVSF